MTDNEARAVYHLMILLFVYFFPWIIAKVRSHQQRGAIFTLNLLLGWTVIGWVVALVWAMIKPQPVQAVQPPTYYREIAPGQFVPVHEIDTTKGEQA